MSRRFGRLRQPAHRLGERRRGRGNDGHSLGRLHHPLRLLLHIPHRLVQLRLAHRLRLRPNKMGLPLHMPKTAGVLPIINQLIQLRIAHKTTLHPQRRRRIGVLEQHIPRPQQPFRPRRIQHHAAIRARGHRKRNTSGEIGLDKTRNHIHRRPLRGQNHMNPRRPRHLRQPGNTPLRILGSQHHQIRQLINNNDNIGQLALPLLGLLAIIIHNVTRPRLGKRPVTGIHLPQRPLERAHHPLHIHHHGGGQMGDAVITRQLHPFGVYHHQLQLFGAVLEQQTGNNRVHADRFARTRRPRHQHVGHFGQIHRHCVPRHILPQPNGQGGFFGNFLERLRLHHIPQGDQRLLLVGHFDAHIPLARHRSLHPHRASGKSQGQVIGQAGNFTHLDLGFFAVA